MRPEVEGDVAHGRDSNATCARSKATWPTGREVERDMREVEGDVFHGPRLERDRRRELERDMGAKSKAAWPTGLEAERHANDGEIGRAFFPNCCFFALCA
jgi:hypothetical protein